MANIYWIFDCHMNCIWMFQFTEEAQCEINSLLKVTEWVAGRIGIQALHLTSSVKVTLSWPLSSIPTTDMAPALLTSSHEPPLLFLLLSLAAPSGFAAVSRHSNYCYSSGVCPIFLFTNHSLMTYWSLVPINSSLKLWASISSSLLAANLRVQKLNSTHHFPPSKAAFLLITLG